MDHTNSFSFSPTYDNNNQNKKEQELMKQDELMSKILSASDFLCSNDLTNAEEVLVDIQELTEENLKE